MARVPVYLDYNASAPLRPEVRALMTDVLAQAGNPSSVHSFGRAMRSRVEKAREQVAALAGTGSAQVIFTSGATEANNAVLRAFAGQRILISALEHPSVAEAAPQAEIIPVTRDGAVDETAFEKMLRAGPPPALVCVMLASNETGAIQPVTKLARLAKEIHPSVHVHTDAAQAAGRMELDFPALHADYLTLAAHKIGGPQGVGALVVAPGAQEAAFQVGGGQEKRRRAGTENVAGIAGFGLAAEIAKNEIEKFEELSALRDALEAKLKSLAPEIVILAESAPRTANTCAFALPGLSAQTQMMALDLDGIAVSSGAACSSGTVKPSSAALAMGYDPATANAVLRVSLGRHTKGGDIDRFLEAWAKLAQRLNKKEAAHA